MNSQMRICCNPSCWAVSKDGLATCPRCGAPMPPQRDYEPLRAAFEADAESLGFDLTRVDNPNVEPWDDYDDSATGHRWGGWIAAHDLLAKRRAL